MRQRYAVMVILLLAIIAGSAPAQEQGFLRFPDASQGRVVFTSEGDLWTASLDGGVARRLTTHDGEERIAKFSPDGQWIAYTAEYDGNQDVYVIPAAGGEPKRLTWGPEYDGVVDWTNDGRIMFRTMANSGVYTWSVSTVSPEGDYPRPLGLDEAALVSCEPGGSRVAYTRIFRNNATWKRYKGGLADQIWVADLKKKEYGKLPVSTYTGHNSYPMWIGDRIYFLSDSTGRRNLWSMKPDGSDQKQHTFHKDWDARWPSYGDGVIVYQLAMDIWKYDVKTGQTSKIDIQLPSERIYTRTRVLNPADYITGWDLNQDGKWMVIAARGQLFTVPTKSRETVIRRLTCDFTCRAKEPFYLGDRIAALSDLSGEDEFVSYDPFLKDGVKQLSKGNHVWRYGGQPSPDGKKIAFSDANCALWVMDAASGSLDQITASDVWEIRDYAWSPNSRYLAYAMPENWVVQAVHVYDLEKKEDHVITDPLYNCYFPAWDPKGKFLYYLAESSFNPFEGCYGAQFIYLRTDKLYLIPLAKDARSPFAPDTCLLCAAAGDKAKDKDKDKDADKSKDKKGKEEEKKEEKVTVKIDWDGLMDRAEAIPVDPGYYGRLRAAEDMLYFASNEHFADPPGKPSKSSLKLYKFKDHKLSTVADDIDAFDLSDDGKVVVVQKDGGFIRMDAGATELPKGEGDEDPHVKLDGWTVQLDPRQEWRQMFREAWRLQRDFFYESNLHGVNWPEVYKHYAALIDRISTRDELNDLIGEMIGELNIGHAYVFGGDLHTAKSVEVGLLGAELSRDGKTGYFRLDKIYAPDRANTSCNSPLAASCVAAKTGDYLIAIDGTPTSSVADYQQLLQDKAGKSVILTLNSKPQTEGSRDVIVKTLSDEHELRYWDWVRSRREYVEKASGGKIGYVHLSDMGGAGLAQFGHEFYPQYDKSAMILDVRYNGGGHVAPMILSQLDRKLWATERPRHGKPMNRPAAAFYGYYAVVCNHQTGSDGETFTEGAKLLGLGPVFGERTWGGWVGIRADKPLNDKVWYTTPEFSGWGCLGSEKGQWLIEGHGVDPDYVIENDPGAVLAGKDPQLDAAIAYLLDKMKKEPREVPKEPPIPVKEVNFPK